VAYLDARYPDACEYDKIYENIHANPQHLANPLLFEAELLHELTHKAADKWFYNLYPSLPAALLQHVNARLRDLAWGNLKVLSHSPGPYAAEMLQFGDVETPKR
jgi:hypothetical protein